MTAQPYSLRASLIIAPAAVLVALFLVSQPWYMPATGLDPSWWAALEYSYLKGLVPGRDFSFPAGPLSVIYTRLFHPQTFPWAVAATLHAAAVYTALICLSPNAKLTIALAIWFAVVTGLNQDVLYLSLPLIVAFLSMRRMAPAFVTAILIVGLALSGLAKFSVMAFCLPLLLLADLLAVLQGRKDFWHAALYCVSIAVFYVISGQPIDGIFAFLAGSLDVALGYGQSMANFSWGQEQTILLLASSGLLASAIVIIRRQFSVASLFCLLALAWFVFFCFRLGNVRVGHQATSWLALATGALLLPFLAEDARQLRRSAFIAAIWIPVGAFYLVFPPGAEPSQPARTPISAVSEFARELTAWLNPGARLLRLAQERGARDEQLAQRAPGDLSGTVSSVPWEFSELIAAGTHFVPSPSLQTYANYTPRLRAQTTKYFDSDARPKNLFFQLSSIDGRYRTLELGPALISILAGYDVVAEHSRLLGSPLQLLSRAHRRSVEQRVIATGTGRMGAWVDVPAPASGSLVLAIRPRETLAGRVLTALYKQERLTIDLRFAGGIVSALAFPSLIGDGFLILPPETTEVALFRAASDGLTVDASNPLTAFRIRPEASGSLRFADYQFEASAVTMSGRPEHPVVQPALAADAMQALITGRIIESPEVRLIGGKLLAHAPTRIVARMLPGKALTGEIGFFDDAWRRGDPRPVTFSISALKSDGNEILLQRTLDPVAKPGDRGPQRFSIALPPGSSDRPIELQFDTYPATSWGWTYWSNLRLED